EAASVGVEGRSEPDGTCERVEVAVLVLEQHVAWGDGDRVVGVARGALSLGAPGGELTGDRGVGDVATLEGHRREGRRRPAPWEVDMTTPETHRPRGTRAARRRLQFLLATAGVATGRLVGGLSAPPTQPAMHFTQPVPSGSHGATMRRPGRVGA